MGAADGVVVIGAGVAGVRTVERLRDGGFAGPLTVVGEETEPPYDRPPLSKQVLRGEREVVRLRDPDSYADLGVQLRLGVRAVGVDVATRTVTLDDATTIGYADLVVATGARARVLPTTVTSGVHVLRTAEDCRRLKADLVPGRRAVVVGGGFIGCEVAASLAMLGLEVSIVEVASAPLVGVLGEQLSGDIVRLHEAAGVTLRCGVGVSGIEGDERVSGVRLADAAVLPADLVVVGLGVAPVLEWLSGGGIATDNGVTCDSHGRTSAPHVYAVGDVAAWRDASTGIAHRFEHWTTAVDQAAIVAHTIVSGGSDPLPVPYFWSDQHHVKIQSLGKPSATADEIVVLDPTDTKRLALYAEGGMLTAVVGIAATALVMKMRSALGEPTPFGAAVQQARALVAR